MRKATIAIAVCALLALALFGAMNGGGGTPALAAAPTPVSITQPVGLNPQLYTLFSGTAITASAQGTCWELGKWAVADVQSIIDVSDTQTVTVKIQYSNNGTNLVDGMNLATSAADASTFVQAPLFGRFACAYATLATTAPVTVSVTAWAK
ncbi:MAG: hypothetical protein IPM07_30845 [Anaerolineales bacterium]|nr:hypothetical protein [Anaerolineales bacterium]